MRYRYLDDFQSDISEFAVFSYGIAVLGSPQCPPHYTLPYPKTKGNEMWTKDQIKLNPKISRVIVTWVFEVLLKPNTFFCSLSVAHS